MNILQCEKVTKTYKMGQTTVTALDGVDLAVEKGEFVAVVGASGSGKSTLLHMLGGVDRPTSGTIKIEVLQPDTNPGCAAEYFAAGTAGRAEAG